MAALCMSLSASVYAMNSATASIQKLWDYADPAASETRFRAALSALRGDGRGDHDLRLELLTQIARTYSLRRRFAEAHKVLDEVEPALRTAGIMPRLRYLLERGRTFNSAGAKGQARPLFVQAWELGRDAGAEDLAIDAAHMVAIVDGGEQALQWNQKALPLALNAKDPEARRWKAALLNNIGYELQQLGRLEEALGYFQRAVPAYEERGDPRNVHSAHWMVAHCLRLLKRHDEALAIQLRLERNGAPDGYVFEELAELYDATGKAELAQRYFRRAADELGKDEWFVKNEAQRYARLKARGE